MDNIAQHIYTLNDMEQNDHVDGINETYCLHEIDHTWYSTTWMKLQKQWNSSKGYKFPKNVFQISKKHDFPKKT